RRRACRPRRAAPRRRGGRAPGRGTGRRPSWPPVPPMRTERRRAARHGRRAGLPPPGRPWLSCRRKLHLGRGARLGAGPAVELAELGSLELEAAVHAPREPPRVIAVVLVQGGVIAVDEPGVSALQRAGHGQV